MVVDLANPNPNPDQIPRFAITAENFFKADGATPEVAARRKASLEGLQKGWGVKFEKCLDFGKELKTLISDVRFTSGRCFPPFNQVLATLPLCPA